MKTAVSAEVCITVPGFGCSDVNVSDAARGNDLSQPAALTE